MSLAFSAGTRNATRKGSTLRTAIPVSDWASAYFPSGLNRNRRKYSRRVDAAPGRRAGAGEAPEFEPSHGVVLVGRDCESNAWPSLHTNPSEAPHSFGPSGEGQVPPRSLESDIFSRTRSGRAVAGKAMEPPRRRTARFGNRLGLAVGLRASAHPQCTRFRGP